MDEPGADGGKQNCTYIVLYQELQLMAQVQVILFHCS